MAWIKLDTQTLLSYDTHVISRDKRLRITDSNKRQWFLHIKEVNVFDRGYYMCQINTEPMISQAGYLDVLGNLLHAFINNKNKNTKLN